MSPDFLTWVAEGTGLPSLEGAAGVVVHASAPAQDLLGRDPTGDDLVAACAALARVRDNDPDLLTLVARAEATGSAQGAVGHERWRLTLHRSEAGRLQVLAAPPQLARCSQLERRAAAADVAAGVSHEVANALSAIVGWAQLGQQPGHATSAETFQLIEERARAARATARRLLDAVRSPEQQPPTSVPMDALVSDVVRLSQLQARERGVLVSGRVQPEARVHGTPSGLFTIVWNLVSNAIEALHPGGHVWASATVEEGKVRFVVADDGPGMDEAQRERAFDPYFTTKPAGTGLGLALVKQAAEELGGRVLLETTPGAGTRFVVELPLAEGTQSDEGRESRRPSGVHGRDAAVGLRVLIVEDDTALREMMRTTLELQRAAVDAVGSAAEALRCTGPYDVALVDLALSDARGDRLVAELRSGGVVGTAAIVTGAAEPGGLNQRGKPDLWLRKPFEPSELIEAVQVLATYGSSHAARP
jgi:signal transduction histidine kinase